MFNSGVFGESESIRLLFIRCIYEMTYDSQASSSSPLAFASILKFFCYDTSKAVGEQAVFFISDLYNPWNPSQDRELCEIVCSLCQGFLASQPEDIQNRRFLLYPAVYTTGPESKAVVEGDVLNFISLPEQQRPQIYLVQMLPMLIPHLPLEYLSQQPFFSFFTSIFNPSLYPDVTSSSSSSSVSSPSTSAYTTSSTSPSSSSKLLAHIPSFLSSNPLYPFYYSPHSALPSISTDCLWYATLPDSDPYGILSDTAADNQLGASYAQDDQYAVALSTSLPPYFPYSISSFTDPLSLAFSSIIALFRHPLASQNNKKFDSLLCEILSSLDSFITQHPPFFGGSNGERLFPATSPPLTPSSQNSASSSSSPQSDSVPSPIILLDTDADFIKLAPNAPEQVKIRTALSIPEILKRKQPVCVVSWLVNIVWHLIQMPSEMLPLADMDPLLSIIRLTTLALPSLTRAVLSAVASYLKRNSISSSSSSSTTSSSSSSSSVSSSNGVVTQNSDLQPFDKQTQQTPISRPFSPPSLSIPSGAIQSSSSSSPSSPSSSSSSSSQPHDAMSILRRLLHLIRIRLIRCVRHPDWRIREAACCILPSMFDLFASFEKKVNYSSFGTALSSFHPYCFPSLTIASVSASSTSSSPSSSSSAAATSSSFSSISAIPSNNALVSPQPAQPSNTAVIDSNLYSPSESHLHSPLHSLNPTLNSCSVAPQSMQLNSPKPSAQIFSTSSPSLELILPLVSECLLYESFLDDTFSSSHTLIRCSTAFFASFHLILKHLPVSLPVNYPLLEAQQDEEERAQKERRKERRRQAKERMRLALGDVDREEESKQDEDGQIEKTDEACSDDNKQAVAIDENASASGSPALSTSNSSSISSSPSSPTSSCLVAKPIPLRGASPFLNEIDEDTTVESQTETKKDQIADEKLRQREKEYEMETEKMLKAFADEEECIVDLHELKVVCDVCGESMNLHEFIIHMRQKHNPEKTKNEVLKQKNSNFDEGASKEEAKQKEQKNSKQPSEPETDKKEIEGTHIAVKCTSPTPFSLIEQTKQMELQAPLPHSSMAAFTHLNQSDPSSALLSSLPPLSSPQTVRSLSPRPSAQPLLANPSSAFASSSSSSSSLSSSSSSSSLPNPASYLPTALSLVHLHIHLLCQNRDWRKRRYAVDLLTSVLPHCLYGSHTTADTLPLFVRLFHILIPTAQQQGDLQELAIAAHAQSALRSGVNANPLRSYLDTDGDKAVFDVEKDVFSPSTSSESSSISMPLSFLSQSSDTLSPFTPHPLSSYPPLSPFSLFHRPSSFTPPHHSEHRFHRVTSPPPSTTRSRHSPDSANRLRHGHSPVSLSSRSLSPNSRSSSPQPLLSLPSSAVARMLSSLRPLFPSRPRSVSPLPFPLSAESQQNTFQSAKLSVASSTLPLIAPVSDALSRPQPFVPVPQQNGWTLESKTALSKSEFTTPQSSLHYQPQSLYNNQQHNSSDGASSFPYSQPLLDPHVFPSFLLSAVVSLLGDQSYAVRTSAAKGIAKYAMWFGAEWTQSYLLPVLERLGKEQNAALRQNMIVSIISLASYVPRQMVSTCLVPLLLTLFYDPVPNVRMMVASALATLSAYIPSKSIDSKTEEKKGEDSEDKRKSEGNGTKDEAAAHASNTSQAASEQIDMRDTICNYLSFYISSDKDIDVKHSASAALIQMGCGLGSLPLLVDETKPMDEQSGQSDPKELKDTSAQSLSHFNSMAAQNSEL
eukprot:MONOS_6518.2-p1 / transcript=MONOS_6518.2 / gene=MONOS_6518 / organism=Monocercomonoides_exilis_PA203 / gene_product=unspecified product / transcript_product=unspecified product / location=Mono_scaffold00206:63006-68832(+) / protein_length=1727 / sequence_SO=supercontig / SO=protein_coding / is_pseudo=false